MLFNRARMTISNTGTGSLTLNAATDGHQTFADAGVADGDEVFYVVEDGSNWEVGRGTYTSSGTSLSRDTVYESTNSDSAISATSSAEVYISAIAEALVTKQRAFAFKMIFG